jgi:hypothetical protein
MINYISQHICINTLIDDYLQYCVILVRATFTLGKSDIAHPLRKLASDWLTEQEPQENG